MRFILIPLNASGSNVKNVLIHNGTRIMHRNTPTVLRPETTSFMTYLLWPRQSCSCCCCCDTAQCTNNLPSNCNKDVTLAKYFRKCCLIQYCFQTDKEICHLFFILYSFFLSFFILFIQLKGIQFKMHVISIGRYIFFLCWINLCVAVNYYDRLSKCSICSHFHPLLL